METLLPDSALKKVASSSSSCDEDPPTSTVWSHSSGMESTLTGVSRPDRSRGGARRWHMTCRPAGTPPAAGTSSSTSSFFFFLLESLQEVPLVRSGESSRSVSRSDSSLSSSRTLNILRMRRKKISTRKKRRNVGGGLSVRHWPGVCWRGGGGSEPLCRTLPGSRSEAPPARLRSARRPAERSSGSGSPRTRWGRRSCWCSEWFPAGSPAEGRQHMLVRNGATEIPFVKWSETKREHFFGCVICVAKCGKNFSSLCVKLFFSWNLFIYFFNSGQFVFPCKTEWIKALAVWFGASTSCSEKV